MKPLAHPLPSRQAPVLPGPVRNAVWLLLALPIATLAAHSGSTRLSLEEFLLLRVQVKNFLIAGGLFAVSIALLELARRNPPLSRAAPLSALLPALLTTALTALAAQLFELEAVDGRFLAALFTAQLAGHLIANYVLRRFHLRRVPRHLLIVGATPRAVALGRELESDASSNYLLLGFVDEFWRAGDTLDSAGRPMVSDFKGFGRYLKENVVDVVLFCLTRERVNEHVLRVLTQCQEQGLSVVFDTQSMYPSKRPLYVADWRDGAGVALEPNVTRGLAWSIKRIADFVISALALAGLAVPFLVIAIAIKASSPGPVFFTQERIGFNKRRFLLYKFRTMVEGAEELLDELEGRNEHDGAAFKMRDDPRVTPLGRALRRWSIDELPQLWNVLTGHMSLVGPRPLPLRDYANFSDHSHCRRQSVPPGLTCLWQINGRSSLNFERWMQMDLAYIDHWSLGLDLRILLRTVPAVLNRSGAY